MNTSNDANHRKEGIVHVPKKQILQHYAEGNSQRRIVDTLRVSRNTVAAVIAAAKRAGISANEVSFMDDLKLIQTLFPEKAAEPVQVKPDFERIHKELLRHGVTLRLLWEEYIDACREAHQPPYMYSQFCKCKCQGVFSLVR